MNKKGNKIQYIAKIVKKQKSYQKEARIIFIIRSNINLKVLIYFIINRFWMLTVYIIMLIIWKN